MTIIIFIAVLLVCVIAHEWGHFFVARKSGMLVEEFGFGIPPKLWKWKNGETTYSINALPIGGFVKIAGENGVEENVPLDRQFDSKPWYLQAAVLVAGVVCNIILAFFLFTVAYSLGMPAASETGTPTIVSVSPNSPAARAGITPGDTVERITINGIEAKTLTTDALREQIAQGGRSVVITYIHNNEHKTAELVPTEESGTPKIGIAIELIQIVKMNVWQAMTVAWQQIQGITGAIWQTLASLVGGLFSGENGTTGLVGPVGLAREVRGAATIGFAYLLAFTAIISVNLAVLNILPFPALDGGRLLVVLLEALFRKKFSRKVVGIIHATGFLVLLGLMLVLTIGDIRRLI